MKDTENPITVNVHYNKEGQNAYEILNKSLWIYIKKEVAEKMAKKYPNTINKKRKYYDRKGAYFKGKANRKRPSCINKSKNCIHDCKKCIYNIICENLPYM